MLTVIQLYLVRPTSYSISVTLYISLQQLYLLDPSHSRKDPMKQGLFILPSCHCLSDFLEFDHDISLTFSMMLIKTLMKLCMTVQFFGGAFFALKIGEIFPLSLWPLFIDGVQLPQG